MAGEDLYMTESGDLAISSNGDLATTDSTYRDIVQQVYIRCMTDMGDFILYPTLGATLSTLFGMPQSPETGNIGSKLIQAALDRDARFKAIPINIKAVPISHQAIRFDISLTSNSRQQILLSVIQKLSF